MSANSASFLHLKFWFTLGVSCTGSASESPTLWEVLYKHWSNTVYNTMQYNLYNLHEPHKSAMHSHNRIIPLQIYLFYWPQTFCSHIWPVLMAFDTRQWFFLLEHKMFHCSEPNESFKCLCCGRNKFFQQFIKNRPIEQHSNKVTQQAADMRPRLSKISCLRLCVMVTIGDIIMYSSKRNCKIGLVSFQRLALGVLFRSVGL